MKSQIRSCKVCGKDFKVYAKAINTPGWGLYCSKVCKGKGTAKSSERECPVCRKKFLARRSQVKQGYGNYCSKPCWASTRKRQQTFNCMVCDKPFIRRDWQIKLGYTKICSRICQDMAKRRLSKNTSKRKGMFTSWQKREWKLLECLNCGAHHDLELDHVIPRFAGGKATRDNAQTLCKKCNREKYWLQDLPYYIWLFNHSDNSGRSKILSD